MKSSCFESLLLSIWCHPNCCWCQFMLHNKKNHILIYPWKYFYVRVHVEKQSENVKSPCKKKEMLPIWSIQFWERTCKLLLPAICNMQTAEKIFSDPLLLGFFWNLRYLKLIPVIYFRTTDYWINLVWGLQYSQPTEHQKWKIILKYSNYCICESLI